MYPLDHHLLGISWQGATYVDRCLPFGLRSAPKIFSAMADALAWAFRCSGIISQIHYLDDFYFLAGLILRKRTLCCQWFLEFARAWVFLLQFIRLRSQPLVDTARFELRLPQEKLVALQSLVVLWGRKSFCTRRELESFIGHLSHAATVVTQGRAFLHELFQLLGAARSPHHHVRLSAGAKADIQWWACFLQDWNGHSFFPSPTPAIHIYSDAAGSVGCGAFQVGGSWFAFRWPMAEAWSRASIAVLELVPIIVASAIRGWQWQGQSLFSFRQ